MNRPDLPKCILTAPLPPEFGCSVCRKQPKNHLVLLPCYHLLCNDCFATSRPTVLKGTLITTWRYITTTIMVTVSFESRNDHCPLFGVRDAASNP
jgi:hypothetical protein